MPSEYDIYRAYAGMNRSKSGFDTFMEGLKEIQAGARADRQLDLQERAQDRADQTMKLNMEQRALTNKRYEENKKDTELKNLIGAARTDYQKAQIYRSFGGGKYDDIAADLEQNYNKQEDNKGLYRDSFYGTEEEQARKLSDFLDVADPTSAMYDKAIVRRNKLLSDIADTSDEILKDPEFGPRYQRFSDVITTPGQTKENIETARKGLIQIEKEYRIKQQKFFEDKTKKTSSIPNVNLDTGYDPVLDYIMEGTVSGDMFADDEKPVDIRMDSKGDSKTITAGGIAPKDTEVDLDVEKITQSDMAGSVRGKTGQQRAQIISQILGRKVSEKESEELIRASIRAGVGERAEEFLEALKTGVSKRRYPSMRASTARQAG